MFVTMSVVVHCQTRKMPREDGRAKREPRKAQEQPYQNLGIGVRKPYTESWSHHVVGSVEILKILENEYLSNTVNFALRLKNLSFHLWPLLPISCGNPYGQTSSIPTYLALSA